MKNKPILHIDGYFHHRQDIRKIWMENSLGHKQLQWDAKLFFVQIDHITIGYLLKEIGKYFSNRNLSRIHFNPSDQDNEYTFFQNMYI